MLVTDMFMPQSFEIMIGKKIERTFTETRDLLTELLFDTLESVAFVVEGNDLGASEDCFQPTTSCINDTRKRQLVIRLGLSRLRCCVFHLHHKWAMGSPAAV